MKQARRPVIIVSRCLGFGACRWDGTAARSEFVESLKGRVTFVTVCPEVGIGLGVPRAPVRVCLSPWPTLVQPSTGADFTDRMHRFAATFLDRTGPIDGAILKSRSPSCAVRDADWFDDPAAETPRAEGPGLFAAAVLERMRPASVVDEKRLEDPANQTEFLSTFAAALRV